MKKIFKTAALLMAAVMIMSVFAGCGGGYNFKSTEAVDSSESQQRWLKYPGSDVVINPSAVSGSDSSDKLKQELVLGVGDSVVNNVLFTLEKRYANGVEGTIVWEPDFSPETTSMRNADELSANNSEKNSLEIVVPDTYVDDDGRYDGNPGKEASVQSNWPFLLADNQHIYPYNFVDNDYYVVIETGECAANIDIRFHLVGRVVEKAPRVVQIGSNQIAVISLNDACRQTSPDTITKETRGYFDFEFIAGGAYQIKSISVKTLPAGNQTGVSSKTEWAPYSMKNTAEVPNGSTVETEDYFLDKNTVIRKVAPKSYGSSAVGGIIPDGSECVYSDTDGILEINGAGNVNYSVKLSENSGVSFFASEEDMLSETKALKTPEGAKFWVADITNIGVGGNAYFQVSLSNTAKASELSEIFKNSSVQRSVKKRLDDLVTEWDEYISKNKDVEEYITHIPEAK